MPSMRQAGSLDHQPFVLEQSRRDGPWPSQCTEIADRAVGSAEEYVMPLFAGCTFHPEAPANIEAAMSAMARLAPSSRAPFRVWLAATIPRAAGSRIL